MPIVAGIDSSPSTTRVVVCDALSGRILRRTAVSHVGADDPHDWWNALVAACANGILDGVQAISVAGQRQALVTVDASGAVVRPALMASDHRAASAADDLVVEGGGAAAWASAVGSVPTASYPIAKLRWLASREPENAARVTAVMQPHDWLTWLLLGGTAAPVTDRGDASGTGYWSPLSGDYRSSLVTHAFGREVAVPRVLGPVEPAGNTGAGVLVAAGTGAAMAAVLGLEAEAGDVVISVGASGTLFAGGLERPLADASGVVSCFADATGRYLAMTRTGEAMPALDAAALMLGTDLEGLSRLALESTPGAQGLVLLSPRAGQPGSLTGLRLARMTAPNLARAAVEGMLCGLADGLDLLTTQLASVGITVRRVILTGRGARLDAVRLIAPAVLGVPVAVALGGVVPDDGQSVQDGGQGTQGVPAGAGMFSSGSEIMAIGAARQAAWVLAATSAPNGEVSVPPVWPEAVVFRDSPVTKPGIGEGIRAQYAGARDAANPPMQVHPSPTPLPVSVPVAAAVSSTVSSTARSPQTQQGVPQTLPQTSAPPPSPGALATSKTIPPTGSGATHSQDAMIPRQATSWSAPSPSQQLPSSQRSAFSSSQSSPSPSSPGAPSSTSATSATASFLDDDYHGRRRQ